MVEPVVRVVEPVEPLVDWLVGGLVVVEPGLLRIFCTSERLIPKASAVFRCERPLPLSSKTFLAMSSVIVHRLFLLVEWLVWFLVG